MTPLYIATGAFDCGKTTTLEWLHEHHGLRVHAEAHLRALASIVDRSGGHPPGRSFSPIDDPGHICPMCQPWNFAQLVLHEQRTIEREARAGDMLERGYLDPIEMLLRNTGADDHSRRPAWTTISCYERVFLFEVMPELQRPRWGKSIERRRDEAQAINRRLERLYGDAGYAVIRVGPGCVEARANAVLAQLKLASTRAAPER